MPHNSTTSSFGFTLLEFAASQNEAGRWKNQTSFVFARIFGRNLTHAPNENNSLSPPQRGEGEKWCGPGYNPDF
jgi:hypothetical protein